ncbi:MAG TPA: FadR/GntR family transcriptional regulator [Polyangiaceae bacterium]|jgi:GntR family transcriptional repressor for pyruvate dehydrogenase complex|nr:FadR/GntR family transcriptional regulator [Polyangiaceae bacterium]
MRTAGEDSRHYKAGSTAEVVLGKIRKMIETGELRPGDRLPAERELAKRFRISRASLRAALHSMAGMGLLQFRHGSGTYIKEGPPVLNDGPLSLLASLHGFTDDEMFEARRHLEVGVSGLAAERASLADLAKMQAEIAGMASALHDPQQYLVHDVGFHRMVASASSNPILAALVELVSTILYQQRRQTVAGALDLAPSLAMHRRIYRAIAARDPVRAREAMNRHLDQTQRARRRELSAGGTSRKKRTPRDNGASRPSPRRAAQQTHK